MTRGGSSLQAFMLHVPFTVEYVREHSHWEIREYLRNISITVASCLLALRADRHQLKDEEKRKQGRGIGAE